MTGEIKWTFNPLVNMAPNQARDYHGRFAAVPGSGGMAMSQEGKMVSKSTTRAGTIPAPHDVTVLSKLGGSTGAKLVVDKAGRKWVMKTGPGPEQLRNEVSADNAYRALGIRTPASGLHVDPHSGVVTKFSRYIEGGQTLHDWEKGKTPNEVSAMHAKVSKGFVADALLANWDAIGMHKDNILIKDGKPLRIDNGGALAYRAQGAPKGTAFGTSVTEVTSLQNSTKNPSAASVYGHIKFGDMDSQVSAIVGRKAQLLESIADPKTRATVEARLTDLVNKFGTTVVNPYTPPPTLAPLPTSSPKPTGQSTTGKQLKELIKGKMKGKDVGLKPNHLFLIENMNPDGAKNGELKIPKGLSPEGVKFLSDSLPHGMKLVAAQSGDSAAAHKLASDKAKEKKLGGATPDSSPLTKPSGVASLKKSPLVKPSSLSDSTAAFPTFFSHTGPTVDTSGKAMTQSQVNEFGKPHEQFAAEFESKWSVSRGLSKEETSETKAFLKETTTHLIGLADPYIKSLSKSTKSGIGHYTASKYIKINSDMRQCPPKFECLQGSSKSISRAIVKAIENSPPLGTPVRCTRGIDLNPMEVVSIMRHAREAAKVGGVYQMPSITSSSVDGMPRLGNDVIFKILAKKGLYVDHVSSTQGEKEMLLSPNSKYRVVKITSEVSGKYSALLKPHIYMEEIL